MRRLPLALLLWSALVFAQTPSASSPSQPPTSTSPIGDATAITAQVIAAFSSSSPQQIKLTGTARGYAGSTQPSGTFTATLNSTGESTLQLNLADLTRTETNGAFSSVPQCQWTGSDGVQHKAAQHNCFLPVHWLVPALALNAQAARLSQSVTAAADEGIAVHKLSLSVPPAGTSPPAQKIAQLSSAKLSLDATTLRPTSLSFNIHPDKDANTDIPILVRYSDYHQINGASIPFHIQRYLNDGLVLDLTVETAEVQ